jgi:toxin secretion/phage lysis holin
MQEIKAIIETIHFVNLAWMLIIPAAMMGIDILTGLIYAFITNSFDSAKMRSGLGKKAGELLIILIGVLFTFGMGIPTYILKGVALYIIFMELMSILENLDKLGVPIPAFISKTLNNINDDLLHQEDIKDLKAEVAVLTEYIKIHEGDKDDGKGIKK